jgi:hypothetical protein
VFFDITIGGLEAGRMKMELFKDVAPRTAENFRRALTWHAPQSVACVCANPKRVQTRCAPR